MPDTHAFRSSIGHPGDSAARPSTGPPGPYDVAVVIPTVGRPSLARAVRSVYAQQFPGTVQVLIGVDTWQGSPGLLTELAAEAPGRCAVLVFDPGYSTAARHGGFCPAGTGGALRTILSHAAHSRLVAYLDDDNWWGPDHLATLVAAACGHDWAYSLRWFADPATGAPLCVDTWESVGPGAGVFRDRFGGFVDPSCLLVDKVACEPALGRWCRPLPGDGSGMSTDRSVFAYLSTHGRGAGTGRATAYYALSPSDPNHGPRLRLIGQARAAADKAGPAS
jgi:hypothetical protein